MKNLTSTDWLLIVMFILALVSVCNGEVLVSIYQAPGDSRKSLVECSYPDEKRTDDRLLILNSQLNSGAVDKWFSAVCLKHIN